MWEGERPRPRPRGGVQISKRWPQATRGMASVLGESETWLVRAQAAGEFGTPKSKGLSGPQALEFRSQNS